MDNMDELLESWIITMEAIVKDFDVINKRIDEAFDRINHIDNEINMIKSRLDS